MLYPVDAEGQDEAVFGGGRHKIGFVAGYGDQRAKNWSNSAVVVHQASGMVVRENVFTHIGYAGVIFGSGRNTIEYNYFRNCMSTLNDGGAIYWNCGDMTVRYNIVVDTRGYLEPVGPSRLLNISHGIWPEYLGGYKNKIPLSRD